MKHCFALALAACFFALPAAAQPGAALASADSSAPAGDAALAPADVASALRKGGYVIYFRHAATDFSKNDASMMGYGDCSNQRLLSDAGRQSAREVGSRIAALKLPVTEAFASPMCRTLETATLMLKKASPRNEMREGDSGDYPGLKVLLAKPVAPGSNRWLVGHGTPFRSVAGAPHLAEGEAAVIRPEGTRWTVVARLQPQDWAALK
jgi:phosphohistidine phosphatase SixA